jgi:hypothetical protein
MESNRKRTKVVMLPTNGKDVAMLSKRTKDGMLQSANGREGVANCNKLWQPQHLYFTTDEEIKEGDWCLKPLYKDGIKLGFGILQADSSYFGGYGYDWEEHHKIIATTDPKLTVNISRPLGVTQELPKPSQAFIEKYCKLGGIDEVDVECEDDNYGALFTLIDGSTETVIAQKLKVDSHNSITIHPIEEQMYSRIQVENYLLELHLAILKAHVNEGSLSIFNSTKWIEENL